MRKLTLLLACVTLCSASPALAELFVNGGFETGDFTGWSLDYGQNPGGGNPITWGQPDHGLKAVIDDTGTMPGQTLDIDPYNGNYMARINDIYGSYHATKIWQQDTLAQEDLDAGGNLYVNWGAALIDPGHPQGDQPFFGINVSVNGTPLDTFTADATDAAGGGWIDAGSDGDGTLWYKSDTWNFDLSSFAVGDTVLVEMFVADCGWGGHGGYAFLDGIGTAYQPPGEDPIVPVPAAVLLGTLGISLAGWLSHRRGELLA